MNDFKKMISNLFIITTLLSNGLINAQNKLTQMENPLLVESKLPYSAPDFSVIKNKHFLPAIQQSMDEQNKKITEIIANPESSTFKNTIEALELSSVKLNSVLNVFFALTSAHTNDTLKEIQTQMLPQLTAHQDEILLNQDLFNRVKEIYEHRAQLKISNEQLKLIEEYYKDFVHAGANLNSQQKADLKEINKQISALQNEFNQTLLNANNAAEIVIKDKTQLKGLTDSQLKALENTEDKTWDISILNTTQQPLMQSLDDKSMRTKLLETSWNRTNGGKHNTNPIIVKLAQLRAQKAALLGYDNYATWSLENTMVKTPKKIAELFARLVPAVRKKGKAEAEELSLVLDGKESLSAADWSYCAEKVRKQKYDLDENEIKEYFELYNVLEKGVFYAATQLYGITFKQRTDIPVYHPDVRVYEVFEEDGTPLALFYTDYFARSSKRGGAWMSNFVTQSYLLDKKPVIYNVCNYQKPAKGEPALISFDDVNTLFHEFGHALHGLFANQQYPKLSGTAVARDFVEYPSQANEHWALHPKVLQNYARHYKTGKVIPQMLIDKIKKASTFNQGFSMTEVMAAADLDMRWHSLSVEKSQSVTNPNLFEKEALSQDNLWDELIPPRYRSSYFAHIFGGGYAAGYYSYLWTEMLAHDTGAWFDENGGLRRNLGEKYRDMILSKGNTQDYEQMYKAFRGKAPSIQAMIEARGLE